MLASASTDEPSAIDPEAAGARAGDLAIGSRIGHYIVDAVIGQGAMARVYRARHSVLNKWIALKVLAPELVTNLEAQQRFFTEARAAAAIQHPHVVTVLDAGVEKGNPYLVMELLDGETLAQHLDRHGPLTVQQLVSVAVPLVAGLAAAHDAGVVHRDLKPANIFLARSSGGDVVPKLLDFGISRLEAHDAELRVVDTARNELLGSPLYMPPEGLLDARSLTQRSDQYSFGVVLYECITGRPPFSEKRLMPLFEAILAGVSASPRVLVAGIPEGLERLILRAMSVDPTQRFAHVRDLGRALLDIAGDRLREAHGPAFLGVSDTRPDPAPSFADVAAVSPSMHGLSVSAGCARERLRPLWPLSPLWPALVAAALLVLWVLSARLQRGVVTAAPASPPIAPPMVAPIAPPLVAPRSAPPMVAPIAEPAAPPMLALPARANAASPATRMRRSRRGPPTDRELEESFFPKRAGLSGALSERAETTTRSNESPLLD